jgi:hypothetical protein
MKRVGRDAMADTDRRQVERARQQIRFETITDETAVAVYLELFPQDPALF